MRKRSTVADDRWGYGSDGYLYDFAKRTPMDAMSRYGSDGYLYDFAKRSAKYDFTSDLLNCTKMCKRSKSPTFYCMLAH